jgi:NitT/TauT family transport system substrate-binding protein
MMSVPMQRLLAMLVATALLAAGCSGGGVASPSASATSKNATGSAAANGELPKPELTKVRIGMSTPNEPGGFKAKLADQLGLFAKYGLTAEVTGFEGDAKVIQSLIAGQLDFGGAGSSTILNTLLTDTPIQIIAMDSFLVSDGLFCGKNIKTAADVKGKQIAVSTFGGTSHGSVLLALKALGLQPSDVVITPVGGQTARIAALKAGSIACAPVDLALESDMKDIGMNMLVDLLKSKLQWGRAALVARTDFLAKNPNTALAVVAAVLEAQNVMYTDQATAAAKFAEFNQVKIDDAKKAIAFYPVIGDRTLMWTDEAFQAPKDVLAAVNPAVASVDVRKASDRSFLDKLRDIGFYKKIGVPLN